MSQLKAATGAVLASHSGDWQLTNPDYTTTPLLLGSDDSQTPGRLFHENLLFQIWQKGNASINNSNTLGTGLPLALSHPWAGTAALVLAGLQNTDT